MAENYRTDSTIRLPRRRQSLPLSCPPPPLSIGFKWHCSALMCALVWLVGDWEYYPVGIVTGFAILALGSWAAYASVSGFGTKLNVIGKYGPPLAYFIAVLVWLRTFRSATPAR